MKGWPALQVVAAIALLAVTAGGVSMLLQRSAPPPPDPAESAAADEPAAKSVNVQFHVLASGSFELVEAVFEGGELFSVRDGEPGEWWFDAGLPADEPVEILVRAVWRAAAARQALGVEAAPEGMPAVERVFWGGDVSSGVVVIDWEGGQ